MTRAFTAGRRRITGLRLAAQRIVARDLPSPVATVEHLLAMQGQDFAGALWAVGLRTAGATVDEVRAALDAGTIVRTWPMRGTLHLIRPEDVNWMLSLTGARGMAASAKRRRDLGIADADLAAARRIAEQTLGTPRPRADLLAAWKAGGQSTEGQRGAHLIVHLAQQGVIVQGPTAGTQQAFALAEQWIRHPRVLDRDEALGELAVRYFTSHGPATEKDLAWWSGLTLGDVRRGIEIAGDAIDTIEVADTTYRLAPGLEPAASAVLALPGFDEYLLGYQDRTPALHIDHAERVVPGGNGMFLSTIVVDGEVVGTWKRVKPGVIEPHPFASVPRAALSRFTTAVKGYARFLGTELQVSG